jgi:hypothetical protein
MSDYCITTSHGARRSLSKTFCFPPSYVFTWACPLWLLFVSKAKEIPFRIFFSANTSVVQYISVPKRLWKCHQSLHPVTEKFVLYLLLWGNKMKIQWRIKFNVLRCNHILTFLVLIENSHIVDLITANQSRDLCSAIVKIWSRNAYLELINRSWLRLESKKTGSDENCLWDWNIWKVWDMNMIQ